MVKILAWGGACLISHAGRLGQNGLVKGIVRDLHLSDLPEVPTSSLLGKPFIYVHYLPW